MMDRKTVWDEIYKLIQAMMIEIAYGRSITEQSSVTPDSFIRSTTSEILSIMEAKHGEENIS